MSELDMSALRRRFPRTCAEFLARPDGHAALVHLAQLEASMGRRAHAATGRSLFDRSPIPARLRLDPREDRPVAARDRFDVVLAGGGLSLIYAASLARAGLKVAVFDRRAIGCGHREWNISRSELAPLSESGLFSPDEVTALVRQQYRIGLCRFGSGADHLVRDVLDCVVDAEALLASLREKAVSAGATLIPEHVLLGYRRHAAGVRVALAPTAEPTHRRDLSARLLIDALGAGSPHAAFDLLCPTVGGVMDDLHLGSARDELDPGVGEILVTTEGIDGGEQHIWEGFPAPSEPASDAASQPKTPAKSDDEPSRRMTIYLFYYQRGGRIQERIRAGEQPLFSLYERFFATLPRYKRGDLRLLRPTYGFIPGYTRLRPMPASPGERVFLVGDAAARHSPLTFCGFGSMVRSFWPIAQGLIQALADDDLSQERLSSLWTEPPALKVMGGLTLMMMPPDAASPTEPADDPDWINRLLDTAFGVLAGFGQEPYAAFLQDRVDAETFTRFMFATAKQQPSVYRKAFAHLSPTELTAWMGRFLQFRRQHPHSQGTPRPADPGASAPHP
jgi:lycopene cyclase CruA